MSAAYCRVRGWKWSPIRCPNKGTTVNAVVSLPVVKGLFWFEWRENLSHLPTQSRSPSMQSSWATFLTVLRLFVPNRIFGKHNSKHCFVAISRANIQTSFDNTCGFASSAKGSSSTSSCNRVLCKYTILSCAPDQCQRPAKPQTAHAAPSRSCARFSVCTVQDLTLRHDQQRQLLIGINPRSFLVGFTNLVPHVH